MFKLPTSHSAFQYSCDIVQPPVLQFAEGKHENNYMEDETAVVVKKKNNRLPGEKLLKQLHKQEMKEREKKIIIQRTNRK